MSKRKSYEDYLEDSTVREVHRIREEFDRQQRESGLSYFEWLEATEADMHKSLAEVGFAIVTRDGHTFIDEIAPRSKRKSDKTQTGKTRNLKLSSHSTKSETAKHKNYDDYIENSAVQEFQGVREGRASSDKIEPQSQKKVVKYKTAAKHGKTNFRKKKVS